MRREAGQGLLFPSSWRFKDVNDLAVITWADASQHNRPDKSSAVGIITGLTAVSYTHLTLPTKLEV